MVGGSQTRPPDDKPTRVLVVDDRNTVTFADTSGTKFASTYLAYVSADGQNNQLEKERKEAERKEELRVQRMKELWKQDQRAVNRRRHL